MSKEYKIEQDVQIPNKRPSPLKDLADKMNAGDSVLVEDVGKATALQSAIKRTGSRSTMRTETNGVRVWKINRS